MQEQLTQREQELLNLLLEGVSPKEIAYRLNISTHTVDFHRNNLYRKLGVMSIQELFAKAQRKDIPTTPTDTQKISPNMMYLMPWTDADWTDGKSTVEFSINQETIDEVNIDDVLTIHTTLAKGCWEPSAEVQIKSGQALQQLRRADGIRFKVRGDGKNWRVLVHTVESIAMDWTSYEYTFSTIRNQTILVDMPYASLRQPERTSEKHRFEFFSENITDFVIGTVVQSQELGSSSIKIWDFEIYRK
jgi:DNA-binding CsgD family transcriptional regulator